MVCAKKPRFKVGSSERAESARQNTLINDPKYRLEKCYSSRLNRREAKSVRDKVLIDDMV